MENLNTDFQDPPRSWGEAVSDRDRQPGLISDFQSQWKANLIKWRVIREDAQCQRLASASQQTHSHTYRKTQYTTEVGGLVLDKFRSLSAFGSLENSGLSWPGLTSLLCLHSGPAGGLEDTFTGSMDKGSKQLSAL